MPERHVQALPEGHRIDEYEIVRVLGAGGFGITYLAFDHQLDGPVALKEYFPAGIAVRSKRSRVVAASTASDEVFAWGLDRFIDEARAIHRFRHPNVVRVHRYVKAHGTAYIVMEYVEGESLAAILETRGPLPATEWRRWLDSLLDGLAHVHGHGYLHRDIKPGNIVVRAADGKPVLIDFGSARVAARDRTHTRVLTPEYAPIEQHSSQGAQGPPTDIYALAAVSYRALTGNPPPSAPDRVLDDQYEPLAGRVASGDPAWLAALDRGLALRPEERPQTVTAWRATMVTVTDDPITPHHASSAPESPAPVLTHNEPASSKRSPTSKRTLVAMWSVVGAVLALMWLWLSTSLDPPTGDSSVARDTAIALDVTDVTTGWLDVGLDDLGRNKLVPAISFRVANASEDHLGMLQLNGVFRRCLVLYEGQPPPEAPVSPADPEAGTCLAEDQEWGGASLIRAAGHEGLDPGQGAGPFTMESRLGYTGEQSLAAMLQHRDFVDVKIELFVKYRAEQWTKLSEHQIDRQLLTR